LKLNQLPTINGIVSVFVASVVGAVAAVAVVAVATAEVGVFDTVH
jgi:hypothetical protein